jgi:hemoglobin
VTSDFDLLGGEPRLRAIIDRFVDRVMDDVMIGFFFRKVDRAQLKRLEYEFAASHLGAKTEYSGRPLDTAHGPHPIMGGQFNRRLVILRKVLEELEAPPEVIERWMAHNERMRPLVTRDTSNECDPTKARDAALEALKGKKS